jgi:predicted nucleic acid-binding protein
VIVLDASAAIELLRRSTIGLAVAARLGDEREDLHVPHLLDVEVSQGLRRLVRVGELTVSRAREAIEDLADLDTVRHSHEVLLQRVWHLRDNLTAYDAVYVALAEALDAPLLTLDARLANAPGHRAEVELL